MYFIVLMAFVFVLTDDLPPPQLDLFSTPPDRFSSSGPAALGTLAIVLAQLVVLGITAWIVSRRAARSLDSSRRGYERAAEVLSSGDSLMLGMTGAAVVITMLMTPWARLVREAWGLGAVPLLDAMVILSPMVGTMLLTWTILFPIERKIREPAGNTSSNLCDNQATPGHAVMAATSETVALPIESTRPDTLAGSLPRLASHRARDTTSPTLPKFLLDKTRHHLLVIAVPMALVVLAKHFIDRWEPLLFARTGVSWAGDSLLSIVSLIVLFFSPVILRFVWVTEPLPDGDLRRRFERICARIGLRYREILLWHTHGMVVNAAVMGLVGPMRYILVSDALLETMDDDEIEAVFGHEAGHVRHHHLQYLALFVLLSMYLAGGSLELLVYLVPWLLQDPDARGLLRILALGLLLACWLFGFGWLSRKFERQADLYGIRCIARDIRGCIPACPVHGQSTAGGLCLTAANLFGRTLARIADLNGIPRDAPSWRHGTIASRCRLVESFASDPAALLRFDQLLRRIKIGLLAGVAIGTAGAALIYADDLAALASRAVELLRR